MQAQGGGGGGMTRMTPPVGATRWLPTCPIQHLRLLRYAFQETKGEGLAFETVAAPKTNPRQLSKQILTDVVVRDVGTSRPDGM